MSTSRAGRHFLQIPGPTNVPNRILSAISRPTIDHRSDEFQKLGLDIFAKLKRLFRCEASVFVYPSSGTGAWECALVNTLNPGDTILIYETGYFSNRWKSLAERLGIKVELLESDWRQPVDSSRIHHTLKKDSKNLIKAVCVVHNETSTGVISDISGVKRAITEAEHDALLMVDTISSLGSIDYDHDKLGVDVSIGASQKGLMLPPGLGFTAASERALRMNATSKFPRSYWSWEEMQPHYQKGFFPYTPATNLLFGLQEALKMLLDEVGLEPTFKRHERHARATRQAISHWGLEMLCQDTACASNTLTAVLTPSNVSANSLRKLISEKFDMSLGTGLGKFEDKAFRIGHLGDLNDLSLAGTLSGVEMGLRLSHIPFNTGGVHAALEYLAGSID